MTFNFFKLRFDLHMHCTCMSSIDSFLPQAATVRIKLRSVAGTLGSPPASFPSQYPPPPPPSRGNCRSDCHLRSLLLVDRCPIGRTAVWTRLPLCSLVTVRSAGLTPIAGCGSSLFSPHCPVVSHRVRKPQSVCLSHWWTLRSSLAFGHYKQSSCK